MSFRVLTALAAALLSTTVVHAAGDAAKAAPIATTLCAACHGADGNSVITMNPKLAGQHPEYIVKQLADFKSGVRNNPVMAGMAATLSPEDMLNMGAYFGSQSSKGGIAASNGEGSVGEKIYKGGIAALGVPACASCHGPNGAGMPVQFPRLAGQNAEYTVIQMKAFRAGERANDANKVMRMVAGKMSDQDIAAVADYVQGLK